MRPELVATDLDGTFLGAQGLALPANLEAAQAITDAGIEFVIATGRPRRDLGTLAPLKKLDPIVIASNGASIGRLAATMPTIIHPIDPDLIRNFVEEIPDELNATLAVEFPHEWGHLPGFPRFHGRVANEAPLDELLSTDPVLKVLLHSPEVNTEQLAAISKEVAGDDLVCTFSWTSERGNVELSAAGVTKGTALSEIISDLGLQPDQCAAFGDMPNDLEMLKLVGRPYVMAGSHPSMFEHGFTVIGHHHEGAVGQQLRSYLA